MNDITTTRIRSSNLRDAHERAIEMLRNRKVPPPMVSTDPPAYIADAMRQRVEYVEAVHAITFWLAAECNLEAHNYCGAKTESIAIMNDALNDLVAPWKLAIEELEQR